MKLRITLFALAIALITMAVSAADFGVHAGYFWGDLKNWTVGADAMWPVGPVAFAPNIEYTRKEGVNFYAGSADIDLRFPTGSGGPTYWIGAGPTYGYITFQGLSDSEWGWDANAGVAWKVGGVKPYVVGRYYKIKEFRASGATIGLRF